MAVEKRKPVEEHKKDSFDLALYYQFVDQVEMAAARMGIFGEAGRMEWDLLVPAVIHGTNGMTRRFLEKFKIFPSPIICLMPKNHSSEDLIVSAAFVNFSRSRNGFNRGRYEMHVDGSFLFNGRFSDVCLPLSLDDVREGKFFLKADGYSRDCSSYIGSPVPLRRAKSPEEFGKEPGTVLLLVPWRSGANGQQLTLLVDSLDLPYGWRNLFAGGRLKEKKFCLPKGLVLDQKGYYLSRLMIEEPVIAFNTVVRQASAFDLVGVSGIRKALLGKDIEVQIINPNFNTLGFTFFGVSAERFLRWAASDSENLAEIEDFADGKRADQLIVTARLKEKAIEVEVRALKWGWQTEISLGFAEKILDCGSVEHPVFLAHLLSQLRSCKKPSGKKLSGEIRVIHEEPVEKTSCPELLREPLPPYIPPKPRSGRQKTGSTRR